MPENKRKLIFVWNYVEWGGAQIYFLGLMKLAKAAWDITILLPRDSDPKLLKFVDDIGEITMEFLERRFDMQPAATVGRKIQRRWRNLRSESEVLQRLRKFDLSSAVLHIEAAPWQSPMLLTRLLRRGANVFVTMHNALPDASWFREQLWRYRIRLVTDFPAFHLFASNADTKERFRRWVSPEVWQRIRVTYTTANPDEIDAVRRTGPSRSQTRAKMNIPEDAFVVLSLGQFIDRKGRWDLLKAARDVVAGNDDVVFVWVTSSILSDDDRLRIAEFGLGDRFRLISASEVGQSRHEILSLYKAADVYALPSYVEGLPVALLEAMAMGVAAVSTNVYAIPEAVIHERTGLLIDAGDTDALAAAILRLKDEPELRHRLGEAGRKHVLANFDERSASRIAIDAYEEALTGRSR